MSNVTARAVFGFLNELALFSTQMTFDNSGFLVGTQDKTVSKALLTLDITPQAVEEAVGKNCELLISHHPIIFDPLKSVTDETRVGKIVSSLIKNDVAAICAHTNLDGAAGGVADCFAAAAGLRILGVLGDDGNGIMRVCDSGRNMELAEFAASLKKRLGSISVRFVSGNKPVRCVAVGPGAGYGLPKAAIKAGCDTILVGEAKYHDFIEAPDIGVNLIDVGHYASERVCLTPLAETLKKAFPDVEFTVSQTSFDRTRII